MLFSLASTLENVRDLRVGKACRGRPGSASETFISACTPFGWWVAGDQFPESVAVCHPMAIDGGPQRSTEAENSACATSW